ncbi:hypothetical protein BDR03DRAFT_970913 [Suillus americanus]|nr:hypothetical protein BDR03DRAFT_970913 [Suillus americanus]
MEDTELSGSPSRVVPLSLPLIRLPVTRLCGCGVQTFSRIRVNVAAPYRRHHGIPGPRHRLSAEVAAALLRNSIFDELRYRH